MLAKPDRGPRVDVALEVMRMAGICDMVRYGQASLTAVQGDVVTYTFSEAVHWYVGAGEIMRWSAAEGTRIAYRSAG